MHPFTPFRIGSLELSNRLLMAPVKTGYGAKSGEVNDRHEAFYRRRAEGGIGALILEPLFIDLTGREHPKQLGITSNDHVNGLKRLVEGLHRDGTFVIAHINHAGRAAKPKASGKQTEAPSAVTCSTTGITPTVMTTDRIVEVIHQYAGASRKAVDAGFDAIEIQFGLGYLIAQFLSSRTNLRHDEYGGSSQNRYRFALEIMSSVRQEIGDRIPIIARISASEQIEDGLELQDAIELAGFLEEHGADALHVVTGSACDSPAWYFQHMRLPKAKNVELAGLIKNKVGIPTIVAGRMGDPAQIREVLDDGIVDGIALGRPLIADPDLPRKMMDNRDEDVMLCGACLQGCLSRVKSGEGLSCIANPEAGRESERLEVATKARKVVVVGGGPAGMQAALTATQRGHEVVLFEKDKLGGQSNLAHLPTGKETMKLPISSLIHRVEQSAVDLRLSRETSVEDILAEKPDAVIIATGAVPIIPTIPGLSKALTAEDILMKMKDVGKRVLVIGGGMVGLECAEFLARQDHNVTVVELLSEVARDMEPITKKLMMKDLNSFGVEIVTDTKITRCEDKKTYVESDENEVLLGEFDSFVFAVGACSVNDLESSLGKKEFNVKVVGDAKKAGLIFDAVRQGYEAAIEV